MRFSGRTGTHNVLSGKYNQGLTIDERLQHLTERHQALTQTVELLASMHQDTERQIQKLVEQGERHGEQLRKLTDLQESTHVLLANVVESVQTLADIAQNREHRLGGLESRQ